MEAGYLFLAPGLCGFLLFMLWPMIQSVYYSFSEYSLLSPPKWTGISNYKQILTDDDTFLVSLKVTILFIVISVPLKLISALLIAMLLKKDIKQGIRRRPPSHSPPMQI